MEAALLARVSTRDLYDQARRSRDESRGLSNPRQRALQMRQADELLVAVAGRAPETPETLALKAQAERERAAFIAAAKQRENDAVRQHYSAYTSALERLAAYALQAEERAARRAQRDHDREHEQRAATTTATRTRRVATATKTKTKTRS